MLDCGGDAAKFVIGRNRQLALRLALVPELLQGEGKQRQDIVVGSLLDHSLAEPSIEVEAETICRPLNHLAEVRAEHGIEGDFFVAPGGEARENEIIEAGAASQPSQTAAALKKARQRLGIVSEKRGFNPGEWWWVFQPTEEGQAQ